MTPEEIGPFLKRVAVTDPRILPDDEEEAFAATALWAVALRDVEFVFALNAVAEHYARSPFLVKPSDIADQWRAHVKNSVSHYVDPAPDTDDPHEYIQQLHAGRRAVQHGAPVPTVRAAIGPGKPQVAAAAAAAAYSEDDIAAIRAQGDFKRMWTESKRIEQAANDARKQLVLRYPDLADRLKQAHGLTSAEYWNGRIPPEFVNGGKRNPSPIRAALVAIVAEAEARATRPTA
jgi:hypothetical protein